MHIYIPSTILHAAKHGDGVSYVPIPCAAKCIGDFKLKVC